MGMNYYVRVVTKTEACPHCGSPIDGAAVKLHIGKQSAGWSFLWRGYAKSGSHPRLKSTAEWGVFLEGKVICNEYGAEINLDDFYRKLVPPSSYYCGKPVINAKEEAVRENNWDIKSHWTDPWDWSFYGREFS